MPKYLITVQRVEKSSATFAVEAPSARKAREKMEKAWEADDWVYEKTTDNFDDTSTRFSRPRKVSLDEAANFCPID